jgi:hypothetical protein
MTENFDEVIPMNVFGGITLDPMGATGIEPMTSTASISGVVILLIRLGSLVALWNRTVFGAYCSQLVPKFS